MLIAVLHNLDKFLDRYLSLLMVKVYSLACILLLFSCKHEFQTNNHGIVHIDHKDGKYILYKNGAPFFIKGASGYTYLRELNQAGGNTIRTWDTTNIEGILKEANLNHIAVIVGLPMPDNYDMNFFYNDQKKADHLLKNYALFINKYKNNPAILFWCLGNELNFPNKPVYNNFYREFNLIVDMIHHIDPNHPVTTTLVTFQRRDIFNIQYRTHTDFISFNIFGALQDLTQELKDFEWCWDGPFLITEWGIDGAWGNNEKTLWAAYIESSSTKKAEQYLSIYKKYMPIKNPRFLGSLVFYWGQKQEGTSTWFGFFDEKGFQAEVVSTMQYIWTSKNEQHKPPQIKYMLVDNKGARDNILFKPGVLSNAILLLAQSDTTGLNYKWHVEPEDWYKINNSSNDKKLAPINDVILTQNKNGIVFITPLKEGPYRLFVNVYDKYGNFASCNTPFYVIGIK